MSWMPAWDTQQVQIQLHNETGSQQQQQQKNQKCLHNKDPTEGSYLNKKFRD